MKQRTVLLGYEISSGAAVEVPIAHMAVTGQTQLSGKTTTLEALISRSGLRAIAFVTKRAEGTFQNARRIPPYFRERADWQFVASLLEATMREKMRFERAWIMRICKGARTLADVRDNLAKAMETAKGLNADVYFTLSEYLDLVVPQLARLPYADGVQLEPGINVMDLSPYASELQALVIRSVLEWVYQHERDTIVIVPEAWEFIPEGRGGPVKLAAEVLIRKGAAAGNYVWLDSQDLAGVDKVMLRACGVFLLGVQREANEVERALKHLGLPARARRPLETELMRLGIGQFFAAFGTELRRVYVQPAWGNEEAARAIARGEMELSEESRRQNAPRYEPTPVLARRNIVLVRDTAAEDEYMYREQIDEATKKLKAAGYDGAQFPTLLAALVSDYQDIKATLAKAGYPVTHGVQIVQTIAELTASHARQAVELKRSHEGGAPTPVDMDAIYAEIKRRAAGDPGVLQILAEKTELRVRVQKRVLEMDGGTLQGRLAQMIASGWFDMVQNGNATWRELQRLGFKCAQPNVYRALDKLAEMGFVSKEGKGSYQATPNIKRDIKVLEANA